MIWYLASSFTQIMLIITAMFLIVSALIIQLKSKKMLVFMRIIKAVMILSIVIGIIDLIAVILLVV